MEAGQGRLWAGLGVFRASDLQRDVVTTDARAQELAWCALDLESCLPSVFVL